MLQTTVLLRVLHGYRRDRAPCLHKYNFLVKLILSIEGISSVVPTLVTPEDFFDIFHIVCC